MPTRSDASDGSGSSRSSGSNDTLPAVDTWASWQAAGASSHDKCLQFRVGGHARVSCLLCSTGVGSPRWLLPFVQRRLPKELGRRLPPLASSQPKQVRDALCESLGAVQEAWLQALEPNLNRRDELLRAPDQGPGEASLAALEAELSAGCSLALAVVWQGDQLYLANLGCTRVLLLRGGGSEGEAVERLTVEHSLRNADELARLSRLGIDTGALSTDTLPVTRCLGAHPHRRRPPHNNQGPDPVSSEPELCGPLSVETGCRLVFLSDGLCAALDSSGIAPKEADRLVGRLVSSSQPRGSARQALSQLLDQCQLPPEWPHELTLMVVSLCEEDASPAATPVPPTDGRVDPYVDFTPLVSALETVR